MKIITNVGKIQALGNNVVIGVIKGEGWGAWSHKQNKNHFKLFNVCSPFAIVMTHTHIRLNYKMH